jgi:tripartite-type tricarboxylate transporter receptor subunit TctC
MALLEFRHDASIELPGDRMIAGSTRAVAMVVLTALLGASNVFAQTYPSKPIRMLVGFATGGGADLTARIMGQKLAEFWGQQVVVDVRAGASGNIAAELVARAAPDGYTLLLIPNSHAVVGSLYKKLAYDPVADFAAVGLIGLYPYVLVVHPSVPAKNVRQLIALAKTRAGQLNYASGGSGVGSHLSAELFKKMAGVDIVHISYKGGGPALLAVISGEASLHFGNTPTTMPHVRQGKLRALAVTGTKPAGDIPTVSDSGLKGFESIGWYGVVAPAATPREVIVRLNTEMNRAAQLPDVKEKLLGLGLESGGGTPEEFGAFIKSEIVKWSAVVESAGIRAE